MTSQVDASPRKKSEFPLLPSEIFFVTAAVAAILAHVVRFSLCPDMWAWWVPIVVFLGIPAADFVSGFTHWLGDTWGTENTPILGRKFIYPFRFHHAQPLNMLESHFFTTNGDPAMIALFFLVPAFFLPLDVLWCRVAAVFVVSLATFGLPTSQCHKWSHMKRPPRIVAWLQRRGLILSPEHHWRHHKSPFRTNYCITFGWCDGILTATRFFPALEWCISRVTGLKPRPDEPERDFSEKSAEVRCDQPTGAV